MSKGFFWFTLKRSRSVGPLDIKKAFTEAEKLLFEKTKKINSINVFPVPDGDTGTNMHRTVEGIVKGLDVENLKESLKLSALENAAGNSGMLLSQFIIGFADSLSEKATLPMLAEGFERGYQKAYNIVETPREGTILTVMRRASEYLSDESKKTKNIAKAFSRMVRNLKKDVMETRNELDVLRESKVVDAGALGFLYIMEAWKVAFGGFPMKSLDEFVNEPVMIKAGPIKFRYCTQILLETEEETALLWPILRKYGNDLRIVRENGLAKIHIHTNKPDEVTGLLEDYGTILKFKAEDMFRMAHDSFKIEVPEGRE